MIEKIQKLNEELPKFIPFTEEEAEEMGLHKDAYNEYMKYQYEKWILHKKEENRIAAEIKEVIDNLTFDKQSITNLLQYCQSGRISCGAAAELIMDCRD